MKGVDLSRHLAALPPRPPRVCRGRVVELTGLVVRAVAEGLRQGELVRIRSTGREPLVAEVVGFRAEEAVLLALGETRGLAPGAEVIPSGRSLTVRAGRALLGRVLDGLGQPIDGRPLPEGLVTWDLDRPSPNPLSRGRIRRPLQLGVRALDALLTAGEGQRIGLFAGSGVGKSTLLGQIARGTAADVVVVGLVGERGREVREFLEESLGPEGLARSG
jgi:ATP synthase in type III secretion protein N